MPATEMIDKLRGRLPGHTHTQRLGMLRFAFSEVRRRCALYAPPVALDDSSITWPACYTTDGFHGLEPARWVGYRCGNRKGTKLRNGRITGLF
jgi:hypothetical protein